jgi:hypothetical protein
MPHTTRQQPSSNDHQPRGARPATPRQLAFLRSLAHRTGQTFAYPTSMQDASTEINRLLSSERSSPAEIRIEHKQIADAIATGPTDAPRHREHEVIGYGADATWAHNHTTEPTTPAASTARRAAPQVGPLTELARYRIPEGERVIYGQRVNGIVRLVDRPETVGGRAYLIERGLETKSELDALLSDYLASARRLMAVPMAESPVS